MRAPSDSQRSLAVDGRRRSAARPAPHRRGARRSRDTASGCGPRAGPHGDRVTRGGNRQDRERPAGTYHRRRAGRPQARGQRHGTQPGGDPRSSEQRHPTGWSGSRKRCSRSATPASTISRSWSISCRPAGAASTSVSSRSSPPAGRAAQMRRCQPTDSRRTPSSRRLTPVSWRRCRNPLSRRRSRGLREARC